MQQATLVGGEDALRHKPLSLLGGGAQLVKALRTRVGGGRRREGGVGGRWVAG